MNLRARIEASGLHKIDIAKRMGLKSRQALDNWLRRGKVPAEFVLKLERATGIPRGLIRSDIYPGERHNGRKSRYQPMDRRAK